MAAPHPFKYFPLEKERLSFYRKPQLTLFHWNLSQSKNCWLHTWFKIKCLGQCIKCDLLKYTELSPSTVTAISVQDLENRNMLCWPWQQQDSHEKDEYALSLNQLTLVKAIFFFFSFELFDSNNPSLTHVSDSFFSFYPFSASLPATFIMLTREIIDAAVAACS